MPPLEPDPDQSRVIAHEHGALRVRGDAGTGKSFALRRRYVRLVTEGDPERVALVVRSRTDRDHARRELQAELRRPLPSLHVITMQALARHVLGERFGVLGYDEMPTILSASDHFARVRELLDNEDPDAWPAYRRLLPMRGFADEIRQFLSRAQESMRTPEDIAALADERDLSGWKELSAFYRRYLDVLDDRNEVDFAGLVWRGALAAAEGEPVLDHLLVDDLQDATMAGAALIVGLRARSTVVAGNEHAHVFSFQGTTDVPFRTLPELLHGTEDIELTQRWRGETVIEAWHAPHVSDEHLAIARELRRIHVQDEVPWRDLAVVVRRQGSNLASVIRALDDARIPHHVPEGGVTFATESATWPYTLALTWISDPTRRDELVEALLTSRLGNLSPASARALLRTTRRGGQPPAQAIHSRPADLGAEDVESLDALAAALGAAEARTGNVADAFMALWHGLPLSGELVSEAGEEGRSADLDTVLALSASVNAAAEGPDPSVAAFVAALEARDDTPDLARLRDSGADAVQVLTAHATAGREFDTVVIAGAVEGDFPSLTRPEPMFDLAVLTGRKSESARNAERLADERRLFDLVLARARRRVLLTASDTGENQDPHDGEGVSRSRFAEGAAWAPAPLPADDAPVSVADAVISWRRALADPTTPAGKRLLALDGLLALGERPDRWWLLNDWSAPGVAYAGPTTMSFSRLKSLLVCELQYVLGQELGLSPVQSGHPAWLGTLIHEVLEACDRGELARDLEVLRAEVQRRWDPDVFPSRAVAEIYRRTALDLMLPHWWETFSELEAIGIEEEFAFDVDGMGFSGRIDRVSYADPSDPAAGTRITDYKTGKAKGRKTDQAPIEEDALQLTIYFLAVHRDERLARFRPVRSMDVAYLRGEKSKGIALRTVPVLGAEDEQIAEIEERLSGLVARVRELAEASSYMAKPDYQTCKYCPFHDLCPAFEGRSPAPVSVSSEGAGA